MSAFEKATEKQTLFIRNALSGRYSYLATGGGIRGTKTFTTLATLITLCRVFPGSRWAIVRKDLPTLKRNVWPSFEKIRPVEFVGPINQSSKEAVCSNSSRILFFPESMTEDPELNRWKGLEVNGFLLEEANELAEKSWYKAIERAGSWIIPKTKENPLPKQPKPLILLTFNPCDNWPRTTFYEPYEQGTLNPPYFYLPATLADNPFLSDEYRESLKHLPDIEYQTFVLGKWGLMDDPNQLIPLQWILAARSVESVPGPRRVGLDVARYGNDETVFAMLSSPNTLSHFEKYKHMDLNTTAQILIKKVSRGTEEYWCDPEEARVDGVGMGAGVVDIARAAHKWVFDLIAGAKALERESRAGEVSVFRFKNLRSQMWWEFREKLRLGLFSLPEDLPSELMADLTAPKYFIKKDKEIHVESKDEIHKRIGRSTDYGDALVEAAFDIPMSVPAVPQGAAVMPFFDDFSGDDD